MLKIIFSRYLPKKDKDYILRYPLSSPLPNIKIISKTRRASSLSLRHRFPLTITIRRVLTPEMSSRNESCAFRGTRGREVTSTTPGRILKGRNRNVHESIPAAVRRRTRRWLPRRVPWNKNRTPGQKPTTTAVLRIPVAAVEIRSARLSEGIISETKERGGILVPRETWKNRRSESRFSDETRDPSSVV